MTNEGLVEGVLRMRADGQTYQNMMDEFSIGRDKVIQILGDAGLIKKKGGFNRGTGHYSAKLNIDKVRKIRRLLKQRVPTSTRRLYTYEEIGRMPEFKVSGISIFKIDKGITWRGAE